MATIFKFGLMLNSSAIFSRLEHSLLLFPLNDPSINLHKARFCELVGNRLMPEDQNEVAYITEPIALLHRPDELKRPPFYARSDAALQKITALRYESNSSPMAYLNLFEKLLHAYGHSN